jgi:hypothetical protein
MNIYSEGILYSVLTIRKYLLQLLTTRYKKEDFSR